MGRIPSLYLLWRNQEGVGEMNTEPATPAQLGLMQKLGIKYPEGISKFNAHRLIGEKIGNSQTGGAKTKSPLFNHSQSDNQVSKESNGVPNRDKLIIRQSCLKAAVEYIQHKPADKGVLALAEEFEAWVVRE